MMKTATQSKCAKRGFRKKRSVPQATPANIKANNKLLNTVCKNVSIIELTKFILPSNYPVENADGESHLLRFSFLPQNE